MEFVLLDLSLRRAEAASRRRGNLSILAALGLLRRYAPRNDRNKNVIASPKGVAICLFYVRPCGLRIALSLRSAQ